LSSSSVNAFAKNSPALKNFMRSICSEPSAIYASAVLGGVQRLCRAFPADDLGLNALGSIFDFIKQKRRRMTAPLSST